MCGSLDAIGSAQLAVDAFKSHKNDTNNIGLKHLMAYGLLQSLYVQQDAVSNLCESIDVPKPLNVQYRDDLQRNHPNLHKIRQLRNTGIGHPSRDTKENTHSFLIKGDDLTLYRFDKIGNFSSENYDILDIIKTQEKNLCAILRQVIEKMTSKKVKIKK